MKYSMTVLALVAIFIASPRAARAEEDVDVEKLYKKAVGSCVYIIVPGVGSGSGSLIDLETKMVLTNYHVVTEKKDVFVQFPMYRKDGSIDTEKDKYKDNVPAGKAIKGTVTYRDKSRDLALVQLDRVPLGTEAIPLALTSVKTGATTWNIGCPGAVAQVFSITEGKVRALGIEKIDYGDQLVHAKFVTTTNPGNPGDSGGPLLDKRGFQVAVTQGVLTDAQLVGKFIDISEVRAFLNEKKITIKELGDGAVDKPKPKEEPKLVTVPKTGETTPPVVEPKKDVPDNTATPAQEREASELLRRSKLFSMGDDNRATYMAKLQEIIKKYPGTMAAKEAKKILVDVK